MNTIDEALRHDIRLLGQLLGTVLRTHEGEALYTKVEDIRRTALQFRREDDPAAARRLDTQLRRLSRDDTITVVRAFSVFSHLANIAEDRHLVRRLESGATAAPGSLAHAMALLQRRGIGARRLASLLADACLMPVLTAHPTEVRRKSILDTERAIAGLIEARELGPAGGSAAIDEELLAAISALWQTRMLRPEKLSVYDEIANALAYWRTTFLREMPAVYAAVESAAQLPHPAPTFLALGSWIGGDRDGHPHVTAATMRAALKAQAETVFDHYAEAVHALGAELSMSRLLTAVSDELSELAAASPDPSRQRADEPYRLALTGVYARLLATAAQLGLTLHARAAVAPAAPYPRAEDFRADLATVAASLRAHGSERIARLRVAPLLRAIDVFGFHGATLDLRQSSDVLEAVVAELMTAAEVCADYRKLAEIERGRLLARELSHSRPLVSAHLHYSARTRTELDVFNAARELRDAFGARAIERHIVSHTETLSDLLEVALLQKECGLLTGTEQRSCRADGGAAVRDDRRSGTGARHHARALGPSGAAQSAARTGGTPAAAGNDARLLRQQQGRRLPDVVLAAVPHNAAPAAGGRRGARAVAAVPRSRRHGRPRRRPQLRRDPRAASRQRARPAAAHRTGRDHPGPLCGPAAGSQPSRDARGGTARGEPGAGSARGRR